jgi:cysteine desulfurase
VAVLEERRDRLRTALLSLADVELTGHPRLRLPGLLSVVVRGVLGDDLVMALDLVGVAVSTGSACTTGSSEPSHVLSAMGYPPSEARGSLRLSLGRTTSEADVERVAALLPEVVARLRAGRRELAASEQQGAGAS